LLFCFFAPPLWRLRNQSMWSRVRVGYPVR
jgi:hypothetical protein